MAFRISQLQGTASSILTDIFHLRTTGGFDKKITLPNLRASIFENVQKGIAQVTLSNYDNDSAPVVKVGSVFDNNGITENVLSSDKTPIGYAGLTDLTTFYLYWDESADVFIYSNTVPIWSDVLQGWYNGVDRALFSMYKVTSGSLYQLKSKLINKSNGQIEDLKITNSIVFPALGSIGTLITAASTAHSALTQYLAGTTVNGNTLIYSTGTTGTSFSGVSYSTVHVLSSSSASFGFTGTWRLLSRVYRDNAANQYPIGLWQRIA